MGTLALPFISVGVTLNTSNNHGQHQEEDGEACQ